MEKIVIQEKPDYISYEMIQEVLKKAHEANSEEGLVYATASQSVESLKEKIGDNSNCYVALVNDKLAGTETVSFREIDYWYYKGKVAIIKLLGIGPDFKGKKIGSSLVKACVDKAHDNNYQVIISDSAEHNIALKQLLFKFCFKTVDYCVYSGNNFYSNVYANWAEKCPYSDFYRVLRYNLKRLYIKFTFKSGKVKRFSINRK